MQIPKMIRISQKFPRPVLRDITPAVKEELNRLGIFKKTSSGQKVAVTVGSRGISNIDVIIKALVDELKGQGLEPCIIPAMGSHGGANAAGQAALLSHFGITERTICCPVISSMEVEEVARADNGVVSYVDREALKADHIIVVNRVKKHTEFEGVVESGLCKMLCIGLGKHKGATHYHQIGVDVGLEQAIITGARGVLKNTNILCGIGIVENAYDETALIKAYLPEEIEKGDIELLRTAKKWSAKLPFQEADMLIIDEIGKEISGSGFDTKVAGRICSPYSVEPKWPKLKRIIALDLTDHSEGNAIGLGALDFIGKRLYDKIDRKVMYINAITAQNPLKAAIPMYYDTDRELIGQALRTIGAIRPENARIMRIRNTLFLSEVDITENYYPLVEKNNNMAVIKRDSMGFNDYGFLTPLG